MIAGLRLAQDLTPRQAAADLLDEAIGKYGFRVQSSDVESDSAEPRICLNMSEPLINLGQDYEPFVQLPDPALVVQVTDRLLCVDGLEHGKRYQITLRNGLPAASGETLHKDVSVTHYVRDRTPSARFAGRSYVLAKSDTAALPIETVNLTRLDLRLRRISDRNLLRSLQDGYFARPLSYWDDRIFAADIAEEVWRGSVEVQQVLNQSVTSRVPLATALNGQPTGIYALSAWLPDSDDQTDPAASQWFVLSDIGLSTLTGTDGLHVQVQSLADATPHDDVELTLISSANSVLGTETSDATGFASFAPGLLRGQGGATPALLVARDGADDLTFLSLLDPGFDLSDRGVTGRAAPGPVDVFLATDRGAYRVGETVHMTALARNQTADAVEGLPLIAVLTRPDGVEYARQISDGGRAGGHAFSFGLGTTAPRGTWTVSVLADPDAPPLSSQRILVEDFMPERIDFTQSLSEQPLTPSQFATLSVEARYLFGAPGADLGVASELVLQSGNTVEEWPGFLFGRYDDELTTTRSYVNAPRTDEAGQTQVVLSVPQSSVQGRPSLAEIITRITDSSERPVERSVTVAVAPDGPMLGLRGPFADVVPEGDTARVEVVALTPELKTMPMAVRWTLNRLEKRYQWYRIWGNWRWDSTTKRTRIDTGELVLGQNPAVLEVPVDWGEYELVVERADGAYLSAAQTFFAGWYGNSDGGDTPDRLDMSLNRAAFSVGETAELRIVSPVKGTALVSVLSGHLIARHSVAIDIGETRVPLSVTEDWGTGAYVTASVLQPVAHKTGRNPVRSLGIAHARVDRPEKQLMVHINAPEVLRPRQSHDIGLSITGARPGEEVFVTLAAVDLGILNMTGFQPPDPSAHYFGQQRLGVELRDLYGRLIDPGTGTEGRVRSGGDAGNGMQSQSPPPTQDLLAQFSGVVTVGLDGHAAIPIDVPAFNGTLRLMAVAWSATAVGQADQDVLVRDPVVMTANLPQFLAPADQSRMLLELTHIDGSTGEMALSAQVKGDSVTLGAVPATVNLLEGQTLQLNLPLLAANAVGVSDITLSLTTPDGDVLQHHVRLAVVDNAPLVSTTQRLTLAAGDTFTLTNDVFANLRSGSGRALISTGPAATFDVPGILAHLDQYPYGCTEQVTSRALPLLYMSSVATASGLGDAVKLTQTIDTAIATVLTRQSREGGFGLWRAENGDFWLDAYVTDFLSRARAQGHQVPQIAFDQAMDQLRNQLNYATDFDKGGEAIAYALLVLAREGAAPLNDLRYYADEKAEAFATPMALAQLGAALATYGDQTRADLLFAKAGARLAAANGNELPAYRTDFGTTHRDAAAVLALAAEVGSNAVDQQTLTAKITHASSQNLSTQEAVWQVMAAQAMSQSAKTSGILVNGTKVTGPYMQHFDDAQVTQTAITAANDRPLDLTLTTLGVPTFATEATGYGYRIERTHYGLDGTPIVLDELPLGTRFVTALRVIPATSHGARLMISDPLPAGVEIDNPNLLQSGSLAAFDWLQTSTAEQAEFRKDRFLAAVDVRDSGPVTLAYVARAVSPGTFQHPAALVEDMYRPTFRANTAAGQVVIE